MASAAKGPRQGAARPRTFPQYILPPGTVMTPLRQSGMKGITSCQGNGCDEEHEAVCEPVSVGSRSEQGFSETWGGFNVAQALASPFNLEGAANCAKPRGRYGCFRPSAFGLRQVKQTRKILTPFHSLFYPFPRLHCHVSARISYSIWSSRTKVVSSIG